MRKTTKYRLRSWQEYNKALKQRGSLTIWVNEEALKNWLTQEQSGRCGASAKFTDLAIAAMATVQAVYHLAGRQTQVFLQLVFGLLKLALPVPDHSTLSRRRGSLTVVLPVRATSAARHLVLAATGVKVYSESEWQVHQHGASKRRMWRKLHLCLDAATFEYVATCASTRAVTDGEMLPELLAGLQPEEVAQVSADGAYDQRHCYEAIAQAKAKAVIPPRRGAKLWQHGNCKLPRQQRDENLRRIRQMEGVRNFV